MHYTLALGGKNVEATKPAGLLGGALELISGEVSEVPVVLCGCKPVETFGLGAFELSCFSHGIVVLVDILYGETPLSGAVEDAIL